MFGLHNVVDPLGDEVASDTESKKTCGDAEEPDEVAFVFLSGDPDVHAPQTGDDVHREDDGAENSELAEDVGGLFLALVHADVDLCEVVAVRTSEDPVIAVSMC